MNSLCLEDLSGEKKYEKLPKNTTDSLRVRVNRELKDILTERDFPSELIANLQTPTTTRCQEFYALPKTHKKELKIRPIVSACGGLLDRL